MTGEFLYFAVYVVQQLGVMLGVGAQTVLLCTHLLAVHRNELESPRASYARAARMALGTGLVFIIVSGLAATALHVLNMQTGVVLAPAYLFKWVLIGLLTVAFFLQRAFPSNTVFYGLVGGTWFALFLIHSLGPVATWETLGALYGAWLVVFVLLWAIFVGLMHWRRSPRELQVPVVVAKKEQPKPMPVVVATPVVVAKPIAPTPLAKTEEPVVIIENVTPTLSWWQRLLALLPKRKAPEVEPPTLPPLPIPVVHSTASKPAFPITKPLPVSQPPVLFPAPVLTPTPQPLLPVVQPLSLQVAHTTPPTPPVVAPPPPPPPSPAPVEKSFLEEVIDHLLVPALRIMPRTAEDIGNQNRPPVVKLGGE